MKKTFRFMAMALAAVVMAGAAVSCDPMDNDDENTEQTDDTQNGDSDENEGEVTPPTLEGKQWIRYVDEYTTLALDFGLYAEDTFYNGQLTQVEDMPTALSSYSGACTLVITPSEEDKTSGSITISDPWGGPTDVLTFNYTNLTETTVMIDSGITGQMPAPGGEMVEFTAATEYYEVVDPFAQM